MQRDFAALGTQVRLIVRAGPESGTPTAAAVAALAAAEATVHQGEALLSRFRPESELSQLNAAAGGPRLVSPLTAACVAAALEAAARTEGLFDPTLLPELCAAGYDVSFAQVPPQRPEVPALLSPPAPGRWRAIQVAPAGSGRYGQVQLPVGVQVDLGGIGKGFLMDHVLPLLTPNGPALASAGGDLAVWAPPGERPWCVAVQDPHREGGVLCHLALREGAVATSSRLQRRWRRGGVELHHLLDPRTGRPAQSDLVQVTVITGSATVADVLAKVALILGRTAAVALLQAQGVPALLVDTAGVVWSTPDVGGFLHDVFVQLTPAVSA